MKRQTNMAQMKEQIKTPGKELNKMEISCWEQSCLVSGTVASLTGERVSWLGLSEEALGP